MPVTIEELDQVVEMYEEAKGRTFCSWNEDYPNRDLLREDILHGDLYCLKEDTGKILGCIAKDRDEAVDRLNCWNKEYEPAAEIARLVIAKGFENQGLAKKIITCMMDEMKRRGFRGIHYLVDKENTPAMRSYRNLPFKQVGKTCLYGVDFLCYERKLADGD